jgi:polyisoprenoid-binding protein YceI
LAKVNWALDKAHSSVTFSVRHMMISNVRGSFNEFDAAVTSEDEDLTTADIHVTIQPTSIDTKNSQRDEHLRSADFFQSDEHSVIEFKASGLKHHGGENHSVDGHLTIKGVTKPVTLHCEITGPMTDPYGGRRIGVVATGNVNRSDFGMSYNAALETGGVLIGDTVKLTIEMEFVKQA